MKITEEDENKDDSTNLDVGVSKHLHTNSIGQLKISLNTTTLGSKVAVKPFNQNEEFERKAKLSVLYNLKTPRIDKVLY